MPIRLPMHPDRELHLVVVKGFGKDPMMLITSLPTDSSFKSQWRVVQGYLSRWRIEETIRFVKQSYGFENRGTAMPISSPIPRPDITLFRVCPQNSIGFALTLP